ncbi:hypothetical protein WN48_02346 [Eufriesea mexicana]|nr:hypothetical protein WN48_02346 [Eufriesea mexicana]
MSSATFVDRIDPFAKRSLKKKSKKSQGSSRYRNSQDVELLQLPQLKAGSREYPVKYILGRTSALGMKRMALLIDELDPPLQRVNQDSLEKFPVFEAGASPCSRASIDGHDTLAVGNPARFASSLCEATYVSPRLSQ